MVGLGTACYATNACQSAQSGLGGLFSAIVNLFNFNNLFSENNGGSDGSGGTGGDDDDRLSLILTARPQSIYLMVTKAVREKANLSFRLIGVRMIFLMPSKKLRVGVKRFHMVRTTLKT